MKKSQEDSPVCRDRFDALFKADKIHAPKTPSKVVSSPLTPSIEIEKDPGKPLDGDDVPQRHMPSSTEEPAGIPPGHPEHREHAAAARINTEIDQEFIMNNEQIPFSNVHVQKAQCWVKCVSLLGLRVSVFQGKPLILLEHVEQRPGADGWVSLPCTDFCPWATYEHPPIWCPIRKEILRKRRKHARKMF